MSKNIFQVDDNGNKCWYLDGQYHREDGPAIEYPNGCKSWYIKGQLHREDGPAVEKLSSGFKRWFLEGKEVSQKMHSKLVKMKSFW